MSQVQKGRHSNIHQSDRCCPFCPNQIEDESHFLIKCPIYSNLRKKLLNDLETLCIGFFYPQDEEFLFWFLLNNPIISGSTAKFIRLGMELRAFLLEEPRKRDWTILLLIFFLLLLSSLFSVFLQFLLFCYFVTLVILLLYISLRLVFSESYSSWSELLQENIKVEVKCNISGFFIFAELYI